MIKENDVMSPISDEQIANDYYQWLCDIIHINAVDKSYWLLTKVLYKKEFYWTVPNDDNRANDGKALRDKFADEFGYDLDDSIDGPCSMLEMLIALAERMENVMDDPEGCDSTMSDNDKIARWFWEMLGNIGVDKYTDVDYYDQWEGGELDDILNKILDRTYKRNGEGGLFPLRMPKKDQRKVELWYQMSTYLMQNYYVEGLDL